MLTRSTISMLRISKDMKESSTCIVCHRRRIVNYENGKNLDKEVIHFERKYRHKIVQVLCVLVKLMTH